jgi:hypothetical protein
VKNWPLIFLTVALGGAVSQSAMLAQDPPPLDLKIDWAKTVLVSKSTSGGAISVVPPYFPHNLV